MKIKKAAELRQRANGQTAAQHLAAVRQAHSDRLDAANALFGAADLEGRQLLASEAREVEEHQDEMRRLDTLASTIEASDEHRAENESHMREQRSRVVGVGAPASTVSYREGKPLTRGQTVEGYVRARQLVRDGEDELDFGKYLRGMATGQWDNADAERRAMAEGTTSAGGFLVPTILSSQIIDLVRNQARVLQAGATIVPMENRTLDVPKWVGDPTAAWHTENAVISPSDAILGKVTLTAQSLASNVEVSWELLEDAPGVETELREAFAAVFALRLDMAALYGSGTVPEPRGVKNTAGISSASMGANGAALTSYDPLIDAVGRLQDQNEEPNGIIYAGRTARSLAKLKDSQLQPLAVPEFLAELPRFSTGQASVTLTQGTSTDASDVFTADWRQLLVGVRTQLVVKPLVERYADLGQTGFIAWWRGDVAVARPKAFDILTGVR